MFGLSKTERKENAARHLEFLENEINQYNSVLRKLVDQLDLSKSTHVDLHMKYYNDLAECHALIAECHRELEEGNYKNINAEYKLHKKNPQSNYDETPFVLQLKKALAENN